MKLHYSMADESEGESFVIIEHKGHLYHGSAYCHPDDDWSKFTGCRYAEERAIIKALKREYQEKKAKCEECRKFVVAIQQYTKFNAEDPTAKAMFRQLNCRIKEVNKLADEISARELALKVAISQQDAFKKKLKEKNNKNV